MPDPSRGPHDERRAQPRMRCDVVFRGARVSSRGEVSDAVNFEVVEISAGGVRFRSAEVFRRGDEAVVEMIGRSGAPGLVALTIVHGSGSGAEATFGARFTAMRPEVLRAVMGEGAVDIRSHRASA
ncbi:MAG: PilZ domain-containing protein [Phycisphaerae bacterium]|nr:PilZ domain-containing protein [Phycisphaerae bacterium]